jgi:hypothetical protein
MSFAHQSRPCLTFGTVDLLSHELTIDPNGWAAIVHRQIKATDTNLSHLTALGSYFRVVRDDTIPVVITLVDDTEIEFGKGEGGSTIALPDPQLCNLHLALARVSAACGASEVFDKYLDEDGGDDGWHFPVYFGGPFVSDDANA